MRVEERERNERWTKRSVLETRRLNGELESLRTQLSDERRARWDLASVMIYQSPRSFSFLFSYPLS